MFDRKKYMREYYSRPEVVSRVKKQRKEYYLKNRDKIAKRHSLYYQKNKKRKNKKDRIRTIEREYGLTYKEYKNLFKIQNNKCAICNTSLKSKPKRFSHIDHCHSTNKVRGILCFSCNILLGGAKDNPQTLKNAIAYLKTHNKK